MRQYPLRDAAHERASRFADTERSEVAVARWGAFPLLPAHLPEPAAQPFVELVERQEVSANAKYAVHPTVKRLISLIRRSIETLQWREVS